METQLIFPKLNYNFRKKLVQGKTFFQFQKMHGRQGVPTQVPHFDIVVVIFIFFDFI